MPIQSELHVLGCWVMRWACLAALSLLAAACVAAPDMAPAPHEGRQGAAPNASEIALSAPTHNPSTDIFYHVFVRSMRDSNGDRHGDLQGLIASLDYLQSLGVTTLLLTPLYPSLFYHNYFASDFEGIDAEYGSMADFRQLVAALHARGMQVYLDEEIQYTDDRHAWYTDSHHNPASEYADFILYDDPQHGTAASGPFGLRSIASYGNTPVLLTSVNLKSAKVQAYFQRYFQSWIDPDGNGDFSDGVDGFRIDHMMDDLDDKGVQTDLFASFWRPIFDRARAINPGIRFIAEQADWGYGADFLTRGDTDFVFAFPLRAAIGAFDKDKIVAALHGTAAATPAGKQQLIFVENHDMHRLASESGITPEKLRTAAALNLLLAGTPIIYYGQELGMRGLQSRAYQSDENDIGVREAFEWTAKIDAPINATWYRGTRPYWTQRHARDDDGVSVEEQDRDRQSLLNTYRMLIGLRRDYAALRSDAQRVLDSAPRVLAIERGKNHARAWLIANLSDTPQRYTLPDAAGVHAGAVVDLLG
ncbi:MAG: alpha-amylase family glycosyl hydrolase, partial [Luteimonas sp.]